MIYLNILLIAIICVFIIDISGFVDFWKIKLWNWTFDNSKPYKDYTLKPFDCSFCMTFWTSLTYTLIIHHLNILMIAYILFIAYLTPVILECLYLLKDMLLKLTDTLNNILNK